MNIVMNIGGKLPIRELKTVKCYYKISHIFLCSNIEHKLQKRKEGIVTHILIF